MDWVDDDYSLEEPEEVFKKLEEVIAQRCSCTDDRGRNSDDARGRDDDDADEHGSERLDNNHNNANVIVALTTTTAPTLK